MQLSFRLEHSQDNGYQFGQDAYVDKAIFISNNHCTVVQAYSLFFVYLFSKAASGGDVKHLSCCKPLWLQSYLHLT